MLTFKILLYASSYIPIFLLIFLNNLNSFHLKDIKSTICSNIVFWGIIMTITVVTLFAFSIFIRQLKSNSIGNSKPISLKNLEIKSNDGETLSYFITYLVPLLTLDLENAPSILMNIILVIIVGLYFVKNNYLHFNVLLLILGYRIYTDNNERVFISRNDLFTIKIKDLNGFQFHNTLIYYIPTYKKGNY